MVRAAHMLEDKLLINQTPNEWQPVESDRRIRVTDEHNFYI